MTNRLLIIEDLSNIYYQQSLNIFTISSRYQEEVFQNAFVFMINLSSLVTVKGLFEYLMSSRDNTRALEALKISQNNFETMQSKVWM